MIGLGWCGRFGVMLWIDPWFSLDGLRNQRMKGGGFLAIQPEARLIRHARRWKPTKKPHLGRGRELGW